MHRAGYISDATSERSLASQAPIVRVQGMVTATPGAATVVRARPRSTGHHRRTVGATKELRQSRRKNNRVTGEIESDHLGAVCGIPLTRRDLPPFPDRCGTSLALWSRSRRPSSSPAASSWAEWRLGGHHGQTALPAVRAVSGDRQSRVSWFAASAKAALTRLRSCQAMVRAFVRRSTRDILQTSPRQP